MNTSYKIVLLGAFVLFAAVIGYYLLPGEGEESELTGNPPAQEPEPEARSPEPPPRDTPDEPEPEPATPRDRQVTIDPPGDPSLDGLGLPPYRTPLDEPDQGAPTGSGIGSGAGDTESPRQGPGTTTPRPGDSGRFGPTTGGDPLGGPDTTPPADDPLDEPQPDPDPQPEPEPEPDNEPEPEPEPSDTPRTTARTYTVQAGDLLSTIAVEVYGDQSKWFDIAQANPTIDPKRLQVGQVLVLPDLDGNGRGGDEARPPAPGRDQTYTVRPGDNLSRIAQRFYGDTEKWDLIYARNRKTIGATPDSLKVGMELVIPQPYDGAD